MPDESAYKRYTLNTINDRLNIIQKVTEQYFNYHLFLMISF